jgi:hypothetical protein
LPASSALGAVIGLTALAATLPAALPLILSRAVLIAARLQGFGVPVLSVLLFAVASMGLISIGHVSCSFIESRVGISRVAWTHEREASIDARKMRRNVLNFLQTACPGRCAADASATALPSPQERGISRSHPESHRMRPRESSTLGLKRQRWQRRHASEPMLAPNACKMSGRCTKKQLSPREKRVWTRSQCFLNRRDE